MIAIEVDWFNIFGLITDWLGKIPFSLSHIALANLPICISNGAIAWFWALSNCFEVWTKVFRVFSRILNLLSWSFLNHGGDNSGFIKGGLEKNELENIGLTCRLTKVFEFGCWYRFVLALRNCEPAC